jgi:hypothetical protein
MDINKILLNCNAIYGNGTVVTRKSDEEDNSIDLTRNRNSRYYQSIRMDIQVDMNEFPNEVVNVNCGDSYRELVWELSPNAKSVLKPYVGNFNEITIYSSNWVTDPDVSNENSIVCSSLNKAIDNKFLPDRLVLQSKDIDLVHGNLDADGILTMYRLAYPNLIQNTKYR